MAIQVLLAGTDEVSIILIDDFNNESVLVPLGEIDVILSKICDIRRQRVRGAFKSKYTVTGRTFAP